ncbi:RNI-like protein [Tothia fuscella]|uniref:RNI-like protein n=1 Tax=Tothia fuscella TaxID=1048955 RepID=A0A9P4U349_9PEZI|nr:RNI-like protein [Tothia fuscella]
MRRYSRPGAGGTMYAHKMNGAAIPDPISLIRSFDSETIHTRPVRPSPLSASTIQGLPLDLIDRLRSFPLFQSAPDSFLAAIGSQLRPQLHNPHDYILTEGDEAKAMYWLVRGSLRVTSRDGESTYAELKPGAFFGEIGILMDIPRTATIVAKLKSLVVRLNKEDLQKVLPNYPDVERAIRDEATERLTILERKKRESGHSKSGSTGSGYQRGGKRPRSDGDVIMAEMGMLKDGEVVSAKKRKSPSPSLAETLQTSALGSGMVNVRTLLKELPLFATLPPEILHFIGLNAQPRNYPPFTEILKQGSTGRDVFFIVRGDVEVINEMPLMVNGGNAGFTAERSKVDTVVKARLKPGQYFGEVVSLSLAKRRTATVRSVSSVECLIISGKTLDELWERCSPDLRRQVERTARERLETTKDQNENDVSMADADSPPSIGRLDLDDVPAPPLPRVTFTADVNGRLDERPSVESCDPDPYLNIDLENVRSRSRRGSLAPPSPSSSSPPSEPAHGEPPKSPLKLNGLNGHHLFSMPSLAFRSEPSSPMRRLFFSNKRPKIAKGRDQDTIGIFPDAILTNIFSYLDIHELMKLRGVSIHWMKLLTSSPDIMHFLDLSAYNRWVTDEILRDIICPFVGTRPQYIDISNCFHVTDEGFMALATTCAGSVKSWRMKSVWDVTGQAVLDMVNKANGLEDVDLSNCRKVGDNLLARVVGWVVPESSPAMLQQQQNQQAANRRAGKANQQQQAAPGTIVGCPKLKRLTLSYCKHITDRSMAHIAVHASSRIEQMDLTRCTTISDGGFQHWSIYTFPRLRKLILADCTYLTDHAIVCLTNAAKGLQELDLSFCCALSDTATEVLALGCPNLTHLNLAFCGSAVSDGSLRSIGLHLLELKSLSVRGCVRVTGVGVEAVVDGCTKLEHFDVSQCRNLQNWFDAGGVDRVNMQISLGLAVGSGGRKAVKFDTVADGRWRSGR